MKIRLHYYPITIDKKKFTDAELSELEDFRQLAIRLKVLQKIFQVNYRDSESKSEKKQWLKCISLLDEVTSHYDDILFEKYDDRLPKSAIHVFY